MDRPTAAPLRHGILPAKDEEAYLAGCLESLRRQSSCQTLNLGSGRSEYRQDRRDRPRDRTVRRSAIRVLTIDHNLLADGPAKHMRLKHASQYANGEWLLFLDANRCMHRMRWAS